MRKKLPKGKQKLIKNTQEHVAAFKPDNHNRSRCVNICYDPPPEDSK